MQDSLSLIMQEERKVDMEKVNARRNFVYLFVKRLFDIFCSIIGLIFLLPIALIVKIIYVLSGDFKPIFYYHTRVGKDGTKFNMYKFRTMVPNAKEMLDELLKDPKIKKEWDENQKLENDPRITKAGKLLRKTSLDELPQMINVFLGNMSIIGPRPLVPGELDKHKGNHNIYEKVKPGVTSWWAAHGRSSTTYKERLSLEYYYIQNRSFKLDLICLLDTVKSVIKKTGAK